MIQDPIQPDPFQELIDLAHKHSFLEISSKSVHNFFSYFVQTHRRITYRMRRFLQVIAVSALVLGDTDDTHDVSRYQKFTILVSCMPRYFLVPRCRKYRDTFVDMWVWQNLVIRYFRNFVNLHSNRHFDCTGISPVLSIVKVT